MLRENAIGWEWEVYIEMFLAGVAAGAYLLAMILEWYGRGRSPIARTAHIITAPLVAVAALLLIYKLERPERFWHMVIQSENIPRPIFKWWAPISAGTYGLMALSAFSGISFIDAIIDWGRRWFGFSPPQITLHGSILGKIWAIGGALSALFIGAYSGALLSVTAVPGWVDTMFLSPFFLAISGATGAAMLLLIESFRRKAPDDEVAGLERASALMVTWQIVLLIIVAISLGGAITFFLSSFRTITALILGSLLAIAAVLLLFFRVVRSPVWRNGLVATMILVSGFLFRFAIVMGPQDAING